MGVEDNSMEHKDDQTFEGYGLDNEAGETSEPSQLETKLLELSLEAYRSGKQYFDTSVRRQLEKNLSNFRGKHAQGSKYHTASYLHRSKLFRPKTRAMTRRQEAALALALFSTQDAVHVNADNETDPRQRVAAAIAGELVSYRLRKSIPWFLTAIGAYQEAMTMGTVISKQYWEYKEERTYKPAVTEDGEPIVSDDTGEDMFEEVITILTDKPVIKLIPRENILFDAAADWTDPIGTSPYLVNMNPMFICDVKERISLPSGKGNENAWRSISEEQLKSAIKQNYDSLRQKREGSERTDSTDQDISITDYTIVWVHENFIRYDGNEYVYWTLGPDIMLSEPKLIGEVYFTGKRPFTAGYCMVEAHRTNPSGTVEVGESLQAEMNDNANQRIDNVRLAMNKRYFIRRGATIDNVALKRSVPGGGVVMDDINNDVKSEDTKDVTGSAYKEQDRLNLDFDELMGTFSSGSIQSNRSMNETVGGMELLSNDSNVMTEYQLRTFVETWVEPTIAQVIELEQAYETDATIIALAGQQAEVYQKFGITAITDDDLQGELITSISVGFGATTPEKRVEKLSIGFRMINEIAPDVIQKADKVEIVSEIMGSLGFRDGSRFFPNIGEQKDDPQVQQLTQMVQELQTQLKTRMDVEQVKQQGASDRQQMKQDHEMQKAEFSNRIEMIKQQLMAEVNDIDKARLMLEQRALEGQLAQSELDYLIQERSSMSQVLQNNKYGLIPGAPG